MGLTLAIGHATQAGPRARNEDFVGVVTPREPDLLTKGVLAAIADGVSGNEGGREAAEYTVRGLLSDYYATPDTWPVSQALDRVLTATNSWVQHQGSVRTELTGMATTLTCVVLRGGFYYFAHVGDSRLYLLRAGTLTRLTTDHVWDKPEMQHVLTRAIGLDSRLAVDHGMGELQVRDVLLLVTDGVWNALRDRDISSHVSGLAQEKCDAESCAAALVQAALDAGGGDNASAMVLRIDALPEQNLRDTLSSLQALPVPPRFKPGQVIDGIRIDSVLHDSRSTLLYRVTDLRTQRALVLKTLQPGCGSDPQERAAFAHEEWLARRAVARFFVQVITPEQRSALYFLTTWHDGSTLQQQLDAATHFTIPDVIAHGTKLVRAVGALHRRSILHRDIKPANVHIGSDGELRLLDFGVAQSGLDGTQQATTQAGTPSYLAPEQFDHAPASRQTDLYAVGVTLYQLLTRRYPYGEIEAFQRPRFNEPTPPTRTRPEIPHWLENVLLRAVARDADARFETAEEFLLALERGATRALDKAPALPLLQRDPLSIWRSVAVISVVLNVLLLYLLVLK
ncbi:bifunctional protein-serine/threonine kinase/phosphatase [Actimicrobium sp. CCI2.3]|uniref:bifunctional protein-serine/threonine kinase/phosphatase n=1 Tax=Actimicrobium sp. CCI2.3 TaxID=3048616 RepID=UPI002AB431B5|nr:bifunctional protein-serine/threonine kinase/phosphatase [Actimicrobium sp. CCI2.3]MDY7576149.1 bifunctional protein-serine/threonine kinase/phosphatase [Actimicrobium sp. CCI2.3]MEB0023449.1 bifunctional protein-serine/threonine kinase/phosphatase [Actimicrobium sp. CCI2.3]